MNLSQKKKMNIIYYCIYMESRKLVMRNVSAGQEQRLRHREGPCGHRRRSCRSTPKRVRLFSDLWTEACQASPSFTISRHFLKLMSIESVMPSNHLILCHPFLFLPSIFPSIRVFSNESVLHILLSGLYIE